MIEAAQHAATVRSVIFIIGFLAIAVTGELLESRTRLYRCAALFGIVLIAAAAVQLTAPPTQTKAALGATDTPGGVERNA